MSLYYDAASILAGPSAGGSFKSRIYNARDTKASPAQIYALITESSKWDIVLKEVIENASILDVEPKLTALLSLLLVHDHLLAKNGIAAPATHPLRLAVERHKTRLRAEFTKARVRRGCASIDQLKAAVLAEKNLDKPVSGGVYPRWVRVNNVRSSLDEQLSSTFVSYGTVSALKDLTDDERTLYTDPNIPDLLAVPQNLDLTASQAYKKGQIILQDKASCFPAYLLLGDGKWDGDLVDACAAPGNKTTHLASLLAKQKSKKHKNKNKVFSMDASPVRSKTLQKMVSTAGSHSLVTILPGQDFLALDPEDPRFANVSGLLLDPSCSGSGIVGRDDVPRLNLPTVQSKTKNQGKKRKRGPDTHESTQQPKDKDTLPTTDENELADTNPTTDRLTKLANLQSRILEQALTFPAAFRVTYSTCSIHSIENEAVVSRVLDSDVAKRRGWRVLRRSEQPVGLRKWKYRGVRAESVSEDAHQSGGGGAAAVDLSDDQLDACLRCWPGDEEGLGGFFVAGFVRDSWTMSDGGRKKGTAESVEDEEGAELEGEDAEAEAAAEAAAEEEEESDLEAEADEVEREAEEEEWEGFSD